MASLSMRGNIGATEIATQIRSRVLDSGASCELVGEFVRNIGGTLVYTMVFEKYYYRVSNVASLSLVVIGDDRQSIVDAVSSGGSTQVFFKTSFGAEENFLKSLEKVLLKNHFVKN